MRVRSRNNISPQEIKKILVRSSNWVGDTVMMIPSLSALKRSLPSAQITVLANPWVIPLLENHRAVDRIMIIDKGNSFFSSFKELARITSRLRSERFDLAVLFQNAFEAAFLAYMGRVRYRVGYDTDGRGFLLTHKVIRDQHILLVHQVEYFLGLIEAMNWHVEEREPILYVNDEDNESTSLMLSSMGIEDDLFIFGINPGAVYGSAKRWPEERFAAIGDWAAKKWNAKVLIFGSLSEREIAAKVSNLMHTNPANLCGQTTLGQAMALIKICNFFLTNDSGLMHVAAAFNIPMVAIFGPTDHIVTSPVSKKARIVRHSVDCSPCLKEVCPSDHRCMLSIEPEEVWGQMEVLKRELKIGNILAL
ncbi:MAG: lipopolysaccharide heptosyltransferase II [Desulfobacteraceae bacterium]|nr:MAG: lipopolysaccharide heptosyltransferase II [Desulfobacteraceae bacterium]